MRHTCVECGTLTSSWRHTGQDIEGHGINPICDRCAGIERFPAKQQSGVGGGQKLRTNV